MLALLYDIHGNLPALEAVLGDAEAAGADAFLLGGDYVLFGAWPVETLVRLRGLGAEWIRGNCDRWVAQPEQAPEIDAVRAAIAACRGALGADAAAELGRLQEGIVREGTRYCHASPASDMEGFPPAPEGDETPLLAGAREPRIVVGHTHLQFRRRAGDAELVNPGSVGMPFDGDHRAAYALVDEDGVLELRRVAYDHLASAAAVRERLGPAGETFARRIERAALDA